MKEHNIEDIARQIYSKAEARPPANAWDKIRAAIAAESTPPQRGEDNAQHATKGTDQPVPASNRWKSYFIVAAATIACIALVIAAITNSGNDPLAQDSLPIASLPPTTQLQDNPSPSGGKPSYPLATGRITHTSTPSQAVSRHRSDARTSADNNTAQQQTASAHALRPTTPQATADNYNEAQQQYTPAPPKASTTTPIQPDRCATSSARWHNDRPLPGSGNVAATNRNAVASTNAETQQTPDDVPLQHDAASYNNSSSSDNNDATTIAGTSRDNASSSQANEPQLRIGNTITPNGDGMNDYFEIRNIELYSPVQVEIFTAHGKRAFFSTNYQNEFNATGLPEGNYFYVITFRTSKVHIRRGTLVVKR